MIPAAPAVMNSPALPTAVPMSPATMPANPVANPAESLQLRDLHMPDPISAWPPAPGWWLVGILGVILLLAAMYGGWRFWKDWYPLHRSRRDSAQQLENWRVEWRQHRNSNQLINNINLELKRFCQLWYPHALNLHGQAWVDFLQQHSRISAEPLQPLASGGYARPDTNLDGDQLVATTIQWLQQQNGRQIRRARVTTTEVLS
ncbi:DUF4381 domain-containing protein [Parathalassolituus penaei]|uniref:DUF4381 domain-containing protein n=1 Tax=Parathalassolituus penaei TaxID=2997323 RepID=A0A9X3ITN4_9GAMM|nr:DUF4381 domain-containing protein [Parathalassolituus penaei]MCY0966500.1 DUF4381 domain-containing protein [Parathalassolituus penaei]